MTKDIVIVENKNIKLYTKKAIAIEECEPGQDRNIAAINISSMCVGFILL